MARRRFGTAGGRPGIFQQAPLIPTWLLYCCDFRTIDRSSHPWTAAARRGPLAVIFGWTSAVRWPRRPRGRRPLGRVWAVHFHQGRCYGTGSRPSWEPLALVGAPGGPPPAGSVTGRWPAPARSGAPGQGDDPAVRSARPRMARPRRPAAGKASMRSDLGGARGDAPGRLRSSRATLRLEHRRSPSHPHRRGAHRR